MSDKDKIEADLERLLPASIGPIVDEDGNEYYIAEVATNCRTAVAEYCRGLVAELDKSLDKAVWNEDQALMRAEAFEKDAGKVPVLRLRIAELEADLHAKNFQIRGYSARLKEVESRVKDEARRALQDAIQTVDGHELIGENLFGPLWGVGWEHCRSNIKLRLQAKIDAAQASERKEDRINALENSYGQGPFRDGQTAAEIKRIKDGRTERVVAPIIKIQTK